MRKLQQTRLTRKIDESNCKSIQEKNRLYHAMENTANENTGQPLYSTVLHPTFPLCATCLSYFLCRSLYFLWHGI